MAHPDDNGVIAALPMYDRAETKAANDHLWQNIRDILGYGPKNLSRGGDVWKIWQAPDLLLAQTCGYPYRARLHPHVTLIGTPDYNLPGCAPGYYNSLFVVRRDDPRTRLADYAKTRFAYNEAMSQSGWAAPQTHAANLGFHFENTSASGAHRQSAQRVAEGSADIAALDALSWEMMKRYDDFAPLLRVIAHTDPTPTLPFISAKNADRPALFAALSTAIADLDASDRAALHLYGLVDIPAATYLAVATPPNP